MHMNNFILSTGSNIYKVLECRLMISKKSCLVRKSSGYFHFLTSRRKVLEEEEKKIRLAKEKSEQGIDNAMYLRQYGYKISYDAFCKQKFRPDYYFIYLNEKVKDAPNILKLPEGDYLCFRERILEEAWNPQRIISYFQGKAKPELMLAMEYEDNLDNYAHANYEIQILLEKKLGNSLTLFLQ